MKDLEKALQSAKASLAVEGLFLTKQEEELVKLRLKNEISEEEFLKRVKRLAQSRF